MDPVFGNDATGTFGNLGLPFLTIQAACNAVPEGVDSATMRREWVILISPGSYDEELVINGTRRHISLIGLGPWNLGAFGGSVANWGPSNTRNLTWNINLGNIDSIRHSLTIGTMMNPGEGLTTHPAYNTGPRISGAIIVNDNVLGGTTKELYVQARVFDNGVTGSSISIGGVGAAAILNVYTWRSQYASAVGGVGARLQWAEKTRFTGLITAATYSRIQSCQVEAGITVTSAVPDIQPSGMIDTVFAGVFTGPAASARMDGNTNFWFKANGAVLAGGATKVIQDDLVP